MIKNLDSSKIIPIIIDKASDINDIVLSTIKSIENYDYGHIYLDSTILKDVSLKNIESFQSVIQSKNEIKNSIIIIKYNGFYRRMSQIGLDEIIEVLE